MDYKMEENGQTSEEITRKKEMKIDGAVAAVMAPNRAV